MRKFSNDKVLIVAAHPDDEVLGCGGTIAMFTNLGVPVRVVFIAEGITARYEPNQFSSIEVKEKIRKRNNNSYLAAKILGVKKEEVFVETRHCCRLDTVPIIDIVKQIEWHISDFKPTKLFTHASNDTNIDHSIVHRAALSATRPVGISQLKSIYSFEVLSSTEWNLNNPFPCQLFFDITDTIDKKVEALAAYDDEMRPAPHPRSELVVRALASFRGAQVGTHYAEGFQVLRSLEF